MNRLVKVAHKNRLSKALKTKLSMAGMLHIPMQMSLPPEQRWKPPKQQLDYVKKNPGTVAKGAALWASNGLGVTGLAKGIATKVIPKVVSAATKAKKPALAATTAVAARPSGQSKVTKSGVPSTSAPVKVAPMKTPPMSGLESLRQTAAGRTKLPANANY